MRRSRVHHDPGPPESRVVALSRRVRGARPERERDVHARQTRARKGGANWGSWGDGSSPGRAALLFPTLTFCVAGYTDEAGRGVKFTR